MQNVIRNTVVSIALVTGFSFCPEDTSIFTSVFEKLMPVESARHLGGNLHNCPARFSVPL
jgi:hypothetical protein